jgi:hypothetical protein
MAVCPIDPSADHQPVDSPLFYSKIWNAVHSQIWQNSGKQFGELMSISTKNNNPALGNWHGALGLKWPSANVRFGSKADSGSPWP